MPEEDDSNDPSESPFGGFEEETVLARSAEAGSDDPPGGGRRSIVRNPVLWTAIAALVIGVPVGTALVLGGTADNGGGAATVFETTPPPSTTSPPRSKETLSEYCSPTGDFCTRVIRAGGKISFEIAAFPLTGSYELCVIGPQTDESCKSFPLESGPKGINESSVDWRSNFPDEGPGSYRVAWNYQGSEIAALSFNP
jgi:hypothetical protein